VLDAAEHFSRQFSAQLLLLRAIGLPPEIPSEAWQDPELSVAEFLERRARRSLEGALTRLAEDVRARTEVEVAIAAPWEALCSGAQAHASDLIVIGSHGYGGLDRVLGTTVSGLAPGDEVAVHPGDRVKEGARVEAR
jgi:nucleotide-binding universal stress UspA family protein